MYLVMKLLNKENLTKALNTNTQYQITFILLSEEQWTQGIRAGSSIVGSTLCASCRETQNRSFCVVYWQSFILILCLFILRFVFPSEKYVYKILSTLAWSNPILVPHNLRSNLTSFKLKDAYSKVLDVVKYTSKNCNMWCPKLILKLPGVYYLYL